METTKPTVFIVDDDASFLAGLARLLRASGFEVEGYLSASEFFAQRPADARGCVVADLRMPGVSGMELQVQLAQSENPMPILFLTGQGDIPTSVAAIRNGAEDFLTKNAAKPAILSAVSRALVRDQQEHAARMRRSGLLGRFSRLTPRDREVLGQVLRGQLNKQIAADLGIDERSVKRHRSSLMTKLEVESVAELARLAQEAGIKDHTLEPSPRP
jgi:two-component system response regulator FixJ